jgi:hypothetical protein
MNTNDTHAIIPADYILLIIIGCSDKINGIVDKLNSDSKKNNSTSRYFTHSIEDPIIHANIHNPNNKIILFDEGVENAQCFAYKEDYKNIKMIVEVIEKKDNLNITFPILNLDDEGDPDQLISSWAKKKKISKFTKDIIIKPVKLSKLKYDILIFSVFIEK